MLIQRLQLEYRLKELGMTKLTLAKRLGVTPMTLHNKFNEPNSFKANELEKMVRIGFLKSLIIEL
jgi:DNA-binding XRE family transcriptional regulator